MVFLKYLNIVVVRDIFALAQSGNTNEFDIGYHDRIYA